jgi:hypothetical protein
MFRFEHPMSLRILLFAACLAILSPGSRAQDIQARAQAMLEHARQLSDIRSSGSPAFRLKATFSFVGDDLEPVQGTYIETWVSDSQWRREIVVNDLRQIAVGGSDKHWLLYPDGFPMKAFNLPAMMAVVPPASWHLDFASIRERSVPGVTAECAYTTPVLENRPYVFCFEKKSGVLLDAVLPQKRPRNVVSFSCEYGSFHTFGDYAFPREALCFEDRHKTISAKVVELSVEPSPDPALFTPPPGAVEMGQCSGKTLPPAFSSDMLRFPGLDMDRVSWLRIWFVVDAKGRPQNVRFLRSMREKPYENASKIVQSWHLTAGTCDGKPMPMPMTVELPFTP